MSSYRLTSTSSVVRASDGAFIPDDVSNIDRIAYTAWLAAGNTPDPYQAPSDTRAAAQEALDRSDTTVIRCVEHKVDVPAVWVMYRAALRAIVAGGPTSAALPVQPSYPAGT